MHLNSIEADNLLIQEENMHIINYDAMNSWMRNKKRSVTSVPRQIVWFKWLV